MIGPLVISLISIGKGKEAKLAKVGVRDSKLLSRKKREFLYDEITSIAEEIRVYRISNTEINKAMAGGVSLNSIEALNFARLIDALTKNPKEIYLDSPDVVEHKFGIRVCLFSKRSLIINNSGGYSNPVEGDRQEIKLISEHKADARYPVVSAASIIAKVTRDAEMDRISEDLGIDLGSGYPSDAKTIRAIKENLKEKSVMAYIRDRWKTIELVKQAKIDEFI